MHSLQLNYELASEVDEIAIQVPLVEIEPDTQSKALMVSRGVNGQALDCRKAQCGLVYGEGETCGEVGGKDLAQVRDPRPVLTTVGFLAEIVGVNRSDRSITIGRDPRFQFYRANANELTYRRNVRHGSWIGRASQGHRLLSITKPRASAFSRMIDGWELPLNSRVRFMVMLYSSNAAGPSTTANTSPSLRGVILEIRVARSSHKSLPIDTALCRMARSSQRGAPRGSMRQTLMAIKYEVSKEPQPEVGMACVRCTGKTAHMVVTALDVRGSEGEFDWHTCHQIVQCMGCKSVSYRVASSNSEEYSHDRDGNFIYEETEKLYPPRLEGIKGLGDDIHYLPQKVRQIYEETLTALSAQAPVLAAIGLRALVETVCKEKEADGSDLFKKLDSLVAKQVLTPMSAGILHKIRTLGNAAAHEVKPHTEEQLGLAMDIVEHLLKDVFILPKKVESAFKDEGKPELA